LQRYQQFLAKPTEIALKTAHFSGFLSGLSQVNKRKKEKRKEK
jgi:hypothetical protein